MYKRIAITKKADRTAYDEWYTIDVKHVEIKIKKNVKKRFKNVTRIKNVCIRRIKKR